MACAGRAIAVVGGGWAGLAAAVEAAQPASRVTLFEMAPQPGGRARDVVVGRQRRSTTASTSASAPIARRCALMREVGVAEADVSCARRCACRCRMAAGCAAVQARPLPAFALAVLGRRGWSWRERSRLLRAAAALAARGFQRRARSNGRRADGRGLPTARARDSHRAALRRRAEHAGRRSQRRVSSCACCTTRWSAARGSADLLLPRVGLGERLSCTRPLAGCAAHGARPCACAHRVDDASARRQRGWRSRRRAASTASCVAASAVEAARLAAPHRRRSGRRCRRAALRADRHRLRCAAPAAPSAEPMLALIADDAPAGAVRLRPRPARRRPPGLLAFVISGAAAVGRARHRRDGSRRRRAQANAASDRCLRGPLDVARVVIEKRATFAARRALRSRRLCLAPGFRCACGDYVDGPYPATLEGAVRRSSAARALAGDSARRG